MKPLHLLRFIARLLLLLALAIPSPASSQSPAVGSPELARETRDGLLLGVADAASGSWSELVIGVRECHSAIYDPVRKRMVAFGGYGSGYRYDVWALSLVGEPTWTDLTPAGPRPHAGCLHTAIYDPVRDRMVVFGGYSGYVAINDLWALSLAGTPAWSALNPIGTGPGARYGQSAIYDPVRDRMVVFGGYSSTYSPGRSDVWALSLAGTPAWTELTPAGAGPEWRANHYAIYDPVRDRMVIFGGDGPTGHCNDVWALTLGGTPSWEALAPIGTPPTKRADGTAIYDPVGDRMLIFGGSDNSLLNDVWALSLEGVPAWTTLTPTGTAPSARYFHSAIYDPAGDRLIVFGGAAAFSATFNDAWALSLAGAPAWSAMTPGSTPPIERYDLSAIYDPVRDRMVLFGGWDKLTLLNDTWVFPLSSPPEWNLQSTLGAKPPRRAGHTAIYDPVRDRMVVFGGSDKNDLWALSLAGTPTWTALAPVGTPPTGRTGHSAIYDPIRDRMVIFGGRSNSVDLSDVWALSLAGTPAWTMLAPIGPPPSPRYWHSAIYDPVGDRMVVFAGSGGSDDVWALTFAGAPAWTELAPPGILGEPSGPSAVYDPVRRRMIVFGDGDKFGFAEFDASFSLADPPVWATLTPTGKPPSPRYRHVAIYDPVRDRMVIFGGRSSDGSLNDVFAQQFGSDVVPVLLSLVSAEARGGRVMLDWFAPVGAGFSATVFRRTEQSNWRSLGRLESDGTGHLRFEDAAVSPETRYAYRLGYLDQGVERFSGETWVEVPALELVLEGLRPNPAAAEVMASFTLPGGAPARLELLDIAGRRLAVREVGPLGAGRHLVGLGGAASVPAGIYWLRLSQGGRSVMARGAVVR